MLTAVTGEPPRPCRSCSRPIWFLIMPSGKRAPYTDSAISHFTDCPSAKKHKRPPRQADQDPTLYGDGTKP